MDIQVLNVSDFHGQLDPQGAVGGAAVLSSYWRQDRAANPNTLLLTAGDAVGASPPLSSFFADAPTIAWMNEPASTLMATVLATYITNARAITPTVGGRITRIG